MDRAFYLSIHITLESEKKFDFTYMLSLQGPVKLWILSSVFFYLKIKIEVHKNVCLLSSLPQFSFLFYSLVLQNLHQNAIKGLLYRSRPIQSI